MRPTRPTSSFSRQDRRTALRENPAHHLREFDAGEADIEAAEGMGEAVVVDA